MMDLTKATILKYSSLYDQRAATTYDERVEKRLKQELSERRFLTAEQLVDLGRWKSRRPTRLYQQNDDLTVQEVTRFCLAAKSERAKVEALQTLRGVKYPVASVILHFAFPDQYPIMDFRAIWSLGWEQPKQYDFLFWQKYCAAIRGLAEKHGLPIRTIDKALWQYSADHQL
jgi:hypothetical protein